jgi:glycosyltransferase involved in cell wall biosynthesis
VIRILFIIRRLVQGGAERQLVELIRHLDKTRFDITLMCQYSGGALWDEAASIPGVRFEQIGKSGRWDVKFLPRLTACLRRLRPDIVHGYMDVANILALSAKPMGARVVWGIRASKIDLSCYDYLQRAVFHLETWLASFPDLIICNSVAARADVLARRFPPDRTIVIPNGIDTQRFRSDAQQRAEVRSQWQIEPHQFLIGMLARLDPMKGHSTFFAAARLVMARFPEARFVVIGDGPDSYRRELRALAVEDGLSDRLVWAGSRNDVPAVLSALDLSVSASSFGEGFSNSLAEAMACGVPCVATKVGDSAAILGGLGWLAEPDDPSGLAEQICAAREASRRGVVEPAQLRERIQTEFGTQRLAQSTAVAFLALMAGRGKREFA